MATGCEVSEAKTHKNNNINVFTLFVQVILVFT